jgi:hypothetical protein
METAVKRAHTIGRMLANRKVVEMQCGICRQGFQLGETVQECPQCQRFHHAACWDAGQPCPQVLESEQPANDSTILHAVADTDSPLVTAPQPSKPITQLAEDERLCPNCKKVIKKDALKCRFCSHILDAELAAKNTVLVAPPGLHWFLLLILHAVTLYYFPFGLLWAIWQARWAKKATQNNHSWLWLVAACIVLLLTGTLREMGTDYQSMAGLLSLIMAVCYQIGNFGVKHSMETYYKSIEPMGLNLSGGMTFFFGPIYFQYHFTRLAQERKARIAAQKEML